MQHALTAEPNPWARPLLGRSPGALLVSTIACGGMFSSMRVFAMLGPTNLRSPILLCHFLLMAAVPWLLLTRAGRAEAGIRRSQSSSAYVGALLFGPLAALAFYLIGWLAFGLSEDHWFVSVANAYRIQPTAGFSVLQLHLTFTIPAMLFSPFGEEIFFRGVLQRALETRFSVDMSTWIESAWFGVVHLVHHGLFMTATGLSFHSVSGPLWVVLTTVLAFSFGYFRKRSRSVFPAVLAHSAFNVAMNALIFSCIWNAT